MSAQPDKTSLFAELQRRNVHRAAVFYAGASWLLMQIASQIFPFFDIPNWAVRAVVIACVIGFPFAMLFSWFFEWTPQGIKRESEIDRGQSVTRETGRKMDRGIIAVLALAVMVLLLNQFVLHRFMPAAGGSPAAANAEKSIAVLPFDNLSDDKGNAYFAAGIQDEILTRLAGIAELKVISRTSTEKYASHPDNLKTVAAELGVGTVLEGSVQKSGDAVRVNVQLIDASVDKHLWAQTYDRELKNVFAVESEVSQDIAEALKARLSPHETTALAALPTTNAAAYDLFLQAEYEANQALNDQLEATSRKAEASYRQAIALDPDFPLAQANLAYCLMTRHWFFKTLSDSELAEVKALTEHVIAVAPELPEAHLARGYYLYWGYRDYDPALAEFDRALALAPSSAQALGAIGYIHRRKGEWPQALVALDKALRLAPRDPVLLGAYGETLMVMRRFTEAEPFLVRALAIDHTSVNTMNALYFARLFGQGDPEGARQAYAGEPPERDLLPHNIRGDYFNLVDPRAFADVVRRRYAEAIQGLDAIHEDGEAAERDRMTARAVIKMLMHENANIRPECARLQASLVLQLRSEPENRDLLSDLGWAELCLGHKAEAIDAARHAAALLPLEKDAYFGASYLTGLAEVDAQAGAAEEALQLISQLLTIPAGEAITIRRLKQDPIWDPLRDDPRFRKIIADGEASP